MNDSLVESGLILPRYRPFTKICAPLANELQRCFWLVDIQAGGLFRIGDDRDELYNRYSWSIPAFANTSTCGLRPGAIPKFAARVPVGEWSCYYAIDSAEDVTLQRTEFLRGNVGNLSKDHLKWLAAGADLLIVHANEWWEFYTPRKDWFNRLQSVWPESFPRSLKLAGEPPDSPR